MQASTTEVAVEALQSGNPAIFPTDTVYGLGVSVEAVHTPEVLYELKERDRGKPIAWLVSSVDDLDRYGANITDAARTLAHTFWPGPLTLVVPASNAVPEAFRSAAGTIGLRMPDNTTALALVRAAGCPLATTSANMAGHPSPRSLASVDPVLGARVGVVVGDDDDTDKSGVASTVLDCTCEPPIVVREGALTACDIEAALA